MSLRPHLDHRRLRSALVLACLLLAAAPSDAAGIRLDLDAVPGNCFGGQTIQVPLRIAAPQPLEVTLAWALAAGHRPLLRGERRLRLDPGQQATVLLDLRLPPVDDGLSVDTELRLRVFDAAAAPPLAAARKTVTLFGRNPFGADPARWRRLGIHLIDPGQRTAERFTAAGIPYTPLFRLEALTSLRQRLIVVGEGAAPGGRSAMADALFSAAAAGNTVLCLAAKSGRVVLPALADLGSPTAALHLRHTDIVAELDKRLDLSLWSDPSGGGAVQGVALTPAAGRMTATFTDGRGWSWADVRFAGTGGRLIYCGHALVDSWEENPAPRYLLRSILDHLATTTDATTFTAPAAVSN